MRHTAIGNICHPRHSQRIVRQIAQIRTISDACHRHLLAFAAQRPQVQSGQLQRVRRRLCALRRKLHRTQAAILPCTARIITGGRAAQIKHTVNSAFHPQHCTACVNTGACCLQPQSAAGGCTPRQCRRRISLHQSDHVPLHPARPGRPDKVSVRQKNLQPQQQRQSGRQQAPGNTAGLRRAGAPQRMCQQQQRPKQQAHQLRNGRGSLRYYQRQAKRRHCQRGRKQSRTLPQQSRAQQPRQNRRISTKKYCQGTVFQRHWHIGKPHGDRRKICMVRLCDILCSQNRTAQGVFPCGRQERRSQQQRRKAQQARRTQRQR